MPATNNEQKNNTKGNNTNSSTVTKGQITTTFNASEYIGSNASVGGLDYFASYWDSIDTLHGSQWGILPVIGEVNSNKLIPTWVNEQGYMKRDIFLILLQPPKFFELLPNSKKWKEILKALFETNSKKVEGLNASLTVEVAEKALGLSGANLADVANVNREATSVTITVDERNGIPYEVFLDVWIRYGLMDPDLKAPLITRIADKDKLPKLWTPEWWSCTAIAIEPDPLYRVPVHAWLISNMFPRANPDITGSKDKSSSRSLKEISIEFGGFALPPTNKQVMALAATIMNNISLWSKDPESIILPTADVDSAISKESDLSIYFEGIKKTNSKNPNYSDGSKSATDTTNTGEDTEKNNEGKAGNK